MSFPKDFLWGAASAAYQIEGAYDEGGKGPGIWDALSSGHIKHDENGNVACDHYHRYREDIALMRQIGLKSYRFSISWPRVIPAEGCINEEGLAFYSRLVDELLMAGIEPIVTLFHWNLPMWLQEKGGWENEAIAEAFAHYAGIVVDSLSDRVRYWLTINEPQCFAALGYATGVHAPFLKKPEVLKRVARNIMLSHGRAVCEIRRHAKQIPHIGMAPTGVGVTPFDETEGSIRRARELTYSDIVGSAGNIWWMDPMILGEIPSPLRDVLSREDIRQICQPLDFFGFNIYHSLNYLGLKAVPDPRACPGQPKTAMDWAITPECLYWMTRFHYERYHLPVMITENGMANVDFPMLDGKVHDPQRIDFIHRYLLALKRAADEGIPVIGYQYWSIMDNFEWAEGYDKRFGLIYVDYRTGERKLKDSAYYYADVIRENGENL